MSLVRSRLTAAAGTLAVASLLVVGASPVMATTYTVDGVGTAPGTFANIALALQALGQDLNPVDGTADGRDSTDDFILITTDALLDHPGFLINGQGVDEGPWGYLTDNITISGDADANGNNVVVAFNAPAGAGSSPDAHIMIEFGIDQRITLRDMILIPSYNYPGVNDDNTSNLFGLILDPCIVVDEGVAGELNGTAQDTGVTLENILFTASAPGDVPITNANAAAPAGSRRWSNDTASAGGFLIFSSNNPGTNNFRHALNNVSGIHGRDTGFRFDADADAGDGRIDWNGGTVAHTVNRGGAGFTNGTGAGIWVESIANTTLQINAVVVRDLVSGANNNLCVRVGGSSPLSVTPAVGNVVIGPGTQLNTSRRGIDVSGGGLTTYYSRLIVAGGGLAQPVVIRDNINRGIFFNSAASQLALVQWTHFIGNDFHGLDLAAVNSNAPDNFPVGPGPEDGPTIMDCIFEGNGGGGVANLWTGQLRIGDANTVPATYTIRTSTFHNPIPSDLAEPARNIIIDSTSSTQLTLDVRDCIFSGRNVGLQLPDDGITIRRGSDNTVNVSNTAFVLAPAVPALGQATAGFPDATLPGGGTNNVLNTTAIINGDPFYATTLFGQPRYFQVRACSYATANSASGPLAGGSNYTVNPCWTAQKGDADGDLVLTIADATYIYNLPITGDPVTPLLDLNNDSAINNADADLIIDLLANGTPLP